MIYRTFLRCFVNSGGPGDPAFPSIVANPLYKPLTQGPSLVTRMSYEPGGAAMNFFLPPRWAMPSNGVVVFNVYFCCSTLDDTSLFALSFLSQVQIGYVEPSLGLQVVTFTANYGNFNHFGVPTDNSNFSIVDPRAYYDPSFFHPRYENFISVSLCHPGVHTVGPYQPSECDMILDLHWADNQLTASPVIW